MIFKNWKKYLPILGISLFVYILLKINISEVFKEIKNINIYFLIMALIFIFFMLIVQTFKWYIIAVFQDIRVPFGKAFNINLISNFYGFVTPSKIGGIVRAEYLKKYSENNQIGNGLFNFTIDKILDICSIIFIVIIFSFVFEDKLKLPVTFFIILFLCFVFLTGFFINKRRSKWALGFFYKKFVHGKMKDKAKMTFESFYENMPKKRFFIIFFLVNLISWVFIYLVHYFIGLALGINLEMIHYLAIMPLGTLVSMIPISINGLGTREAALISLFAIFNIGAAKVFSMSILAHLIVGVIPSIIGIFLIYQKNLT